jgi:hypothetical protein
MACAHGVLSPGFLISTDFFIPPSGFKARPAERTTQSQLAFAVTGVL